MITHIFVADVADYTKLLDKHCQSDDYGEYSTVDQAKTACDSDSNCIGVYDADCNGKPQIALCPKGSDFEESQVSCIYQKGVHTYALINKCVNIYFNFEKRFKLMAINIPICIFYRICIWKYNSAKCSTTGLSRYVY